MSKAETAPRRDIFERLRNSFIGATAVSAVVSLLVPGFEKVAVLGAEGAILSEAGHQLIKPRRSN